MLIPFLIFVVAASVALILLAFFMNSGRSVDETGQWIKDSVHAWREGELELDSFEIDVQDTRVKDVFSSFDEADGSGYVSMGDVNTALRPVADSFQHVLLRRKV